MKRWSDPSLVPMGRCGVRVDQSIVWRSSSCICLTTLLSQILSEEAEAEGRLVQDPPPEASKWYGDKNGDGSTTVVYTMSPTPYGQLAC